MLLSVIVLTIQSSQYSLLFVISLLGLHGFPFKIRQRAPHDTLFSRKFDVRRLSEPRIPIEITSTSTIPVIRRLHVHYSSSHMEISYSIEEFLKYFKKSVSKCSTTSHKEKKQLLNELMVWVPHLLAPDLVKVMNTLILLKLSSRSKVHHLTEFHVCTYMYYLGTIGRE